MLAHRPSYRRRHRPTRVTISCTSSQLARHTSVSSSTVFDSSATSSIGMAVSPTRFMQSPASVLLTNTALVPALAPHGPSSTRGERPRALQPRPMPLTRHSPGFDGCSHCHCISSKVFEQLLSIVQHAWSVVSACFLYAMARSQELSCAHDTLHGPRQLLVHHLPPCLPLLRHLLAAIAAFAALFLRSI